MYAGLKLPGDPRSDGAGDVEALGAGVTGLPRAGRDHLSEPGLG